MPKVTAYQCSSTKKLFSLNQKNKFVSHLFKLRASNTERRKYNKEQSEFYTWRDKSVAEIASVKEIEEWLMNGALLRTMKFVTEPKDWDLACYKKFKITSVVIGDYKYSESCSNTHESPRGKKTNWGGKEKEDDGTPVPRGYPGFRGMSVRVNYEGDYPSFSLSHALTKLGIATGGGGGAGGSSSYSYTLWLDDWAKIKALVAVAGYDYEQEHTIAKLKGKRMLSLEKHIQKII